MSNKKIHILGVIPARSGSKGIKKKNLIKLNNKPLIQYTIEQAKKSKYILLNAPNDKISDISKILPVLKSPTVLPLNKKGWSSLHSVIDDESFWEVIDELKLAGAEDILVCPIEKMVI